MLAQQGKGCISIKDNFVLRRTKINVYRLIVTLILSYPLGDPVISNAIDKDSVESQVERFDSEGYKLVWSDEFSKDGVEKLSIVDGGEFDDGDPLSPGRQIYYVGKIIIDSTGAETFFNIFTVVFD